MGFHFKHLDRIQSRGCRSIQFNDVPQQLSVSPAHAWISVEIQWCAWNTQGPCTWVAFILVYSPSCMYRRWDESLRIISGAHGSERQLLGWFLEHRKRARARFGALETTWTNIAWFRILYALTRPTFLLRRFRHTQDKPTSTDWKLEFESSQVI